MAKLDLAASFLMRGSTPNANDAETLVELSVNDPNGGPVFLKFPPDPADPRRPVRIWVALSLTLGCTPVELVIEKICDQSHPTFYGLIVRPENQDVRLQDLGPCVLGIIVEQGADRGQTLACSCTPARVAYTQG